MILDEWVLGLQHMWEIAMAAASADEAGVCVHAIDNCYVCGQHENPEGVKAFECCICKQTSHITCCAPFVERVESALAESVLADVDCDLISKCKAAKWPPRSPQSHCTMCMAGLNLLVT